jgi:hypothetical protein
MTNSQQFKLIRKVDSSERWRGGDLDVAFQLFRCGMVWDGNIASKDSLYHFCNHGYAARAGGFSALTGRGTVAFLTSRAVWASAFRRWRRLKKNPFVAGAIEVHRALD